MDDDFAAKVLDPRRSPTGNETNEMFRAMKADRKARLDAEEPKRLDQMRTVCGRLGVQIRELTPYQFRLTFGERWVDYCPRTRKVVYKNDHIGDGLRKALQFIEAPDPDTKP